MNRTTRTASTPKQSTRRTTKATEPAAEPTAVKEPAGSSRYVPETFHVPELPIPIECIQVSHNDRTEFDEEAIETLAESIRERGLDNAVTVRRVIALEGDPDGERFELIAGERRLRACIKLGFQEILARVLMHCTEKDADLLRLEENILRVDLSPIDKAAGIQRYMELHGESQKIIGKRFGMTQAQVSNLLRLLKLPNCWQQAIRADRIAHTLVRDVLLPWVHRESLLIYVAEKWVERQQMERNDREPSRQSLESWIREGVQELSRSCSLVTYHQYQQFGPKTCCFRVTDAHRASLDVEEVDGMHRAWNVDAWETLNKPARSKFLEKQKKERAKLSSSSSSSKTKNAKAAVVQVSVDRVKLERALASQLLHSLASQVNPKKHKSSIHRVALFLAAEDYGDFPSQLFGERSWNKSTAEKASALMSPSDAEFPGWLCSKVEQHLRNAVDFLHVATDVLAIAEMLPVDLMHDWLPNEQILDAYTDESLQAFAHDHEIDDQQPRLKIIAGLLKPGVWQKGYVPQEIEELLRKKRNSKAA